MANPSVEELQALISNISKAAKSYDPDADPASSFIQRAAIRGAAKQLLQSMTSPEDYCWEKVLNMTELIGIRTSLQLNTFGAVPLKGSISKTDLAQKVNATESLVERMMRVLVGTGMFDQTRSDGGEYKHTKFSESFIDTTKPGPGTFFQAMFDVYFRTTVNFDKYMIKHANGGINSEPSSNFCNPFVEYYGQQGQSVWDIMPTVPDVMRTFQISLKGVDQIVPPTGPYFDFSRFKASGLDDEQIQIVDIGGGYGKVLQEILTATPDLDPKKCVLQDVAGVIGISQEVQSLGVKAQAIDFHKEQPVKAAKAYYMRFISHDYADADLHNILTHISSAMSADSTLLLADCVIPDRLVEATLTAGVLDQIMFCIGGKERTETGFREVLAKVGLELVRIHHVPDGMGAVIEGRKVKKDGVVVNGGR